MTDTKKYRIGQLGVLALVFLAIYYLFTFDLPALLGLEVSSRWHDYLPLLRKLSVSLCTIMVIMLLGRLLERSIDGSRNSAGVRYNLIRVTRLTTYVLVAIVAIAFLFQNLYAAALSFGLISLVLGFALQAPIASFIGWLYIVFRRPYHVGDRIQLDALRGDVVEISYLDTLIRECSGSYLGNDRSSGRLIHFPNSVVLKAEVINYCGQFKPFIWNETALQIGYRSDLEFVETCLLAAANEDFRQRYPDREGDDHAAAVYFRNNRYAWMEAVVQYPVEPADTTGRRNRILRHALPALNAQTDKVQFPQGTQR